MTEEKEVVTETNGEEKNGEAKNGEEKNEADNNEEESDVERAIIRQVEYYFGDINLPRDRFLRDQVNLDDGWVTLDVLTRFNRLSKITTDIDLIVKALNKSTSGLLEISEDNKKIRRNPELPIPEMNEERRKEVTKRTIYAKGFPKDICLDELLKFFKQYEEVENIIMRRYLDKVTRKRLFKGSIFATFKTKEQADKFMETEAKTIKYNDVQLLIHWQDDYIEQKQLEYTTRREKKEKPGDRTSGKQQREAFKLPTGTVLKFTGGKEGLTREEIKEGITAIDSAAEISYIDFKSGDETGWIRFSKKDKGKDFEKKVETGTLKAGKCELVLELIEGQEETTYLAKTVEEMSKRRRHMKNNKTKKTFKGKGKKRRQDKHTDAPPAKVKADS